MVVEASTRVPVPSWLEPLYPFRPRMLRSAGGAWMSYLDEGQPGRHAVLLLHGNPTWSFYYRDLIAALALHVRCVAPDHIGMGLSDKPQQYPYTLAGRIADIGRLIDALGLDSVDLVLHDWGGAIGMGWAVENEPRVRRIVLLNTAAFPSLRIPWRIALCRWGPPGEFLVRGLNGFAAPATRMAMSRRQLTSLERRGYLLPYDSWAARVAVHRFVRDIPLELDHPTRPVLERIARALPRLELKPMLLGWGGRDFCFNRRFFERWRELFPHAQVDWQESAGHYVLEDAGAPLVSRIRQFLLST